MLLGWLAIAVGLALIVFTMHRTLKLERQLTARFDGGRCPRCKWLLENDYSDGDIAEEGRW